MFVVIQTRVQLCDRKLPLIQMILLLIFLLPSLLQQYGTDAESSDVSKLQLSSIKEPNGVQESLQEKVLTVSGEGMIHSPDFPHTYPRDTMLVWRLVAADNMRIQLTFDKNFGLEDPEDGICKYDFVEIEDPTEKTILGRWCGSQSAPTSQKSKGSQVIVRFISDEYFPSEPGFCLHYSLLPVSASEPEATTQPPPSLEGVEELLEAVAVLSTVEDVMKYLEPERWQLDMEELDKPTWHVLGKSFIFNRKARGADLNLLREEVRLYSCTPRNYSVSLREELKRTDVIFWPSCLLVKRCGGNCACCSHRCVDCQCVPARVTKKYHEVLLLKHRGGGKSLQKSMTDVALEHHEECSCVCKDNRN
ncbi:platelet-derived growth factor C-like [Poeciliopsis prolifica]|uniref:platelet-derived growth factor C-like n=1 Tax=Poeciliopsis prolifica TaxID=188132 RepID=UPI00241394EA|nr:platelet-derived growth factor C-like [Poeciliopsis prolifica]XP_054887157.1 platelet-derived growth factor C-like [Poeciliopsis prolifica]XP_054887159.1 platelet-derived growth factor C-like [Poeciliopsis prolifica]XP_054887160.1 platelet-derived growth factor C-like [Poeciliopsis prolifica]